MAPTWDKSPHYQSHSNYSPPSTMNVYSISTSSYISCTSHNILSTTFYYRSLWGRWFANVRSWICLWESSFFKQNPSWSACKIMNKLSHVSPRLTFYTSSTWTRILNKTFIRNVSPPTTNTSFHNVTYPREGLFWISLLSTR